MYVPMTLKWCSLLLNPSGNFDSKATIYPNPSIPVHPLILGMRYLNKVLLLVASVQSNPILMLTHHWKLLLTSGHITDSLCDDRQLQPEKGLIQ